MSQVLVNESTLQNTANTIRNKIKKVPAISVSLSASDLPDVLRKDFDITTSGSGTASGSVAFIDYFSGVSVSHWLIQDRSDCTYSYPIGANFQTMPHDFSGGVIIVPNDTSGYQGKYRASYQVASTTHFRGTVYPLDENYNAITYNSSIHANLPHGKYNLLYMMLPKQTSLLYPSDFSQNINNIGSGVFHFYNSMIDVGTFADYDNGKIPCMDLRYFGINSIEDIKYLSFCFNQYVSAYIAPYMSSYLKIDPPAGREDFGYGYPTFRSRGYSGGSVPFIQSIYMYYKDGRLYVDPTSGTYQKSILRTDSANHQTLVF